MGKKGNDQGGAIGCKHNRCPEKVTKFGFCKEHFDQFKFGLIDKHGNAVPDFDKKFDHYMRMKAKSA